MHLLVQMHLSDLCLELVSTSVTDSDMLERLRENERLEKEKKEEESTR